MSRVMPMKRSFRVRAKLELLEAHAEAYAETRSNADLELLKQAAIELFEARYGRMQASAEES